MKRDNKQRLFDLMKILNEDFVPRSVGVIGTRSVNTDTDMLNLSKTYEQSDNWHKPNGLWYQINSSWNRWCDILNKESDYYKKRNIFQIKRYNIVLDIDFTDIIILDTRDKVIDFSEKYGNGEFFIRWSDVIKEYKGIEIPNYNNVRYYKWMNGWDVDSGCIWDLTAIKNYTVNDCEIIK